MFWETILHPPASGSGGAVGLGWFVCDGLQSKPIMSVNGFPGLFMTTGVDRKQVIRTTTHGIRYCPQSGTWGHLWPKVLRFQRGLPGALCVLVWRLNGLNPAECCDVCLRHHSTAFSPRITTKRGQTRCKTNNSSAILHHGNWQHSAGVWGQRNELRTAELWDISSKSLRIQFPSSHQGFCRNLIEEPAASAQVNCVFDSSLRMMRDVTCDWTGPELKVVAHGYSIFLLPIVESNVQ